MIDFFGKIIFEIGNRSVNLGQLVWMVLFLLSWVIVLRMFFNDGIGDVYEKHEIDRRQQKKLRWILGLLLVLTSLILIAWIFKVDTEILVFHEKSLTVLHAIKALCILQAARLIDWTISNIFIHRYYQNRKKLKEQRIQQQRSASHRDEERGASMIVQYIVYILALIFTLRSFDLDYVLGSYAVGDEEIDFKISKILIAILILLIARLAVSLITQIILFGVYANKEIDEGSQYAINQLFKYVIYVVAIIYTFRTLGIDMTLILGGAAALLVGIGLGLQQTFNDFISGIVLLFERSISVGDVVDIETTEGKVQKIGMRASIIETRENKTIVVPNSKLVNDIVHNWSHVTPTVRFDVSVGVAYGSDTALVKKLLLEAVDKNDRVLKSPTPFVRFGDFQDSALLFTVFFFTNDHMFNDDIKSDIRFEIDKLFREHEIGIPFPQQDVWIRSTPPK